MVIVLMAGVICGVINNDLTIKLSKSISRVKMEYAARPIYPQEPEVQEIVEEFQPDPLDTDLGKDVIKLDEYNIQLVKYKLPRDFNPKIDDSSFQPIMRYDMVTNKRAPAYKIVHSENAYTDENGFRRYRINSEKNLTIDGKDDYIVALGNFYKKKGEVGIRYLVVTTTGSYTMIVGDEKANQHTDQRNQYTTHSRGRAGVIEWVVSKNIHPSIRRHGTVTKGPVVPLQGKIKYIYKMEPISI
jgi:hypothetical protein